MRKVETVVVPAFGRDDGKIFQINEMSAARAEKWAWRMFIALKGTTGEVPPEVMQLGMVGVAIRGLNAFLQADVKYELLEPLLDEMLTCVTIVRDRKNHPDVADTLREFDIEEVQTLAWLRSEVLRVHTGFSVAETLSQLVSAVMNPQEGSPTT